jgi:hypothetical protein
MSNEMSTRWLDALLRACHKIKDNNGYFTRKDLVNNCLNDIVKKVGSVGKSPDQTLSRELQNLRDRGFIIFVSRGRYQVTNKKISELEEGQMSTGAKIVFDVLLEMYIIFEKEKKFDDLKDKSYLPIDFYFVISGIRFAIEFDGPQHEISVELFGGEKEFEKRKNHDRKKNQYCTQNNIYLLRLKKPKINIIRLLIADWIATHTASNYGIHHLYNEL